MELKFLPFPQRIPPVDTPVLVRLKVDGYYPEDRYYCMVYTKKYNADYYVFREAGGERYSEEPLDNVIGWLPYSALDSIPFDECLEVQGAPATNC